MAQTVWRTSERPTGRLPVGSWLAEATNYRRAAGYFSSTVFGVLSSEFAGFFDRGGQTSLVCSPYLSAQDLAAVVQAVRDRPRARRLWSGVLEAFGSEKWSLVTAYLIAHDLLRLRVALRSPPARDGAIYHEKFGLATFSDGTVAAFVGSANETGSGIAENFERLELFFDWRDRREADRVRRLEADFQALWTNHTPGVEVLGLAEAVELGVFREVHLGSPSVHVASSRRIVATHSEVLIPPAVDLWPHQLAAIAAWGNAGGQGILEMATGSGKTLTALSIASRVYDRLGGSLAVLVVAPLIHLVDQWISEAARFGLRPIRCAEVQASWRDQLDSAIFALNSGHRQVLSMAVTATTMGGSMFQQLAKRIRTPMLIIGDEVHHYGTADAATALPANANLRLGLSATPERWMDPEGTRRVESYFGRPVFSYGLEDAIRDRVLTPYRYYPETVELSEEEFQEFIDLTELVSRYCREDDDQPLSEAAKMLLIKRARVVGSAGAKIPRLRSMLELDREVTHVLVVLWRRHR